MSIKLHVLTADDEVIGVFDSREKALAAQDNVLDSRLDNPLCMIWPCKLNKKPNRAD